MSDALDVLRPGPITAKGDGFWSQSTCDPRVWWYGVPGSGCHYWTQRFGQYWVSGGVHATYAAWGYECGPLGPPVKPYDWLTEFAAWGQWFENGAIYYKDGAWRVAIVNWGQTAGRDTDEAGAINAKISAKLAALGLVPDVTIDLPFGAEPWAAEPVAAPADAEVPPDPPGDPAPAPRPPLAR